MPELQLTFTWEEILDWVSVYLLGTGLRVGLVLLLSWLAFRMLAALLRKIERSAAAADPSTVSLHEQRMATLLSLMRSVGVVIIVVIGLFMVLTALGLQIGPLLAGAGVVGLAISFGAQSLVRDIISGLFILFENQFGVGDVIRVGDAAGRVEKMTLRIVVMRDIRGALHVVPNGEITRVSNLTRAYARAVLEIRVSYREDIDRVMEVMRDVGRGLWVDPEWRPLLSEEPTVPGIESFGESSVNVRMMATTLPLKQWEVARELRRRIKRRFDEESIEMPFFFWAAGDREQGTAGNREQGPGNSLQQQ
jgi:moderate conductance mechanosensitive channel